MSSIGTGYDLYTTTFSPDGRVFQVEYASKAVENSGTVLGVRCKDGVVLAVEKLIPSKMLVRKSNPRIFSVDHHAGVALAGLFPDGRPLVNRGRQEARSYKNSYGSIIPAQVLSDRLAGFMHAYTLYWYVRPFGIAMLLAAYDEDGPGLYCLDPSGQSLRYRACAVGKAKAQAKVELEKINFETLGARDAVKELARILYALHDEVKDKDFEVEISWVCDETKRVHKPIPQDLMDEAVDAAKAAREAAEMDAE
eukprot:TRINITY_DN1352_c0_g1::TRINITY_DN1352_c0_g1_i1::g.20020::m.20020 TRINITY_DN1352_c0_g1::TRINITY_DN1352_c0_g1_i1::g.20020  ORF type:complete len:268 (+),score=29.18,sp/O23715/PSA3_ARATH/57.77/2e-105,Proteasome/PF00227.21/1.1e-47,Proteasome_A_N/PF10584.4/1.3e-13,Proteasome_A_N/PF10584.4/5.5e+03 TRINITY_DN1352_c0_g1_i1:49-804(+)